MLSRVFVFLVVLKALLNNICSLQKCCFGVVPLKFGAAGVSIKSVDNKCDYLYNRVHAFIAVVVQLARTSPCQGEGRRFESGLPLRSKNRLIDYNYKNIV